MPFLSSRVLSRCPSCPRWLCLPFLEGVEIQDLLSLSRNQTVASASAVANAGCDGRSHACVTPWCARSSWRRYSGNAFFGKSFEADRVTLPAVSRDVASGISCRIVFSS